MITLDQFMDALSGQESGGLYDAENERTKAYGRFQIVPENWPSWAKEAGIPGAEPTPANQDRVARFKLGQYYDRFGNWEDVASAWYSGSPRSAYTPEQLSRKQGYGDEPSINEYVSSVMNRAGGSTGGSSMTSPQPGQSSYAAILAQIDALSKSPPAFGTDAYDDWLAALTVLASNARTLRPPAEDDPARGEFQDKITAANTSIALDGAGLARTIADIDRFFAGKEESRARAGMKAEAQAYIGKYGTLPGKNTFSARDLGAGLTTFANILGVDPDAQDFARYSGTQWIDPEMDLFQGDRALGVGGEPPVVPPGLGGGIIPVAPTAAVPVPPGPAPTSAGIIDINTGTNAAATATRPSITQPATSSRAPSAGGAWWKVVAN